MRNGLKRPAPPRLQPTHRIELVEPSGAGCAGFDAITPPEPLPPSSYGSIAPRPRWSSSPSPIDWVPPAHANAGVEDQS